MEIKIILSTIATMVSLTFIIAITLCYFLPENKFEKLRDFFYNGITTIVAIIAIIGAVIGWVNIYEDYMIVRNIQNRVQDNIYNEAYEDGYEEGYIAGYKDGYNNALY